MWKDHHPNGVSMNTHLETVKDPLLDPNSKSNWIDNRVDINQYRGRLIISDRVNGDMQLLDAANLDNNYQDKAKAIHSLHLSSNCAETFDINIVNVDNRFEIGNENDMKVGVSAPIALTQFKMQKSKCKMTD